jgi:hypothetical protein
MNLRTCVVITGLVVGAFGCVTPSKQDWTKAGAGPDELARDRHACMEQSRVPYRGFDGEDMVAIGGTTGSDISSGSERTAQTQANRIFDACMEARGWY